MAIETPIMELRTDWFWARLWYRPGWERQKKAEFLADRRSHQGSKHPWGSLLASCHRRHGQAHCHRRIWPEFRSLWSLICIDTGLTIVRSFRTRAFLSDPGWLRYTRRHGDNGPYAFQESVLVDLSHCQLNCSMTQTSLKTKVIQSGTMEVTS